MPIRDYVRSVREAFHPGEAGSDSSSSKTSAEQVSNDGAASAPPRRPLRGDLPFNKLFFPDSCLDTLLSTVYRPQDKMTGVITALHGALGAPGGYSEVQVALYADVRLVQTSEKGSSCTPIYGGGGGMTLVPHTNDVDTFEKRLIKVAGNTLYAHREEGIKEGKEIILPFQLLIPTQAEGFQLAPSLATYIRYFLCIRASEYDTGHWRDLCLDDIQIKPRDDALESIDSLSICDPFLMIGPYQELDLAKQPRWILAKETLQQVPCPSAPIRKKKAQVEEAEGTAVVRMYTPPHDLFVQRPFPIVVKLSVVAPASYAPQDANWASFRLETPAAEKYTSHRACTTIKMHLSPTRGGHGTSYERLALASDIQWEVVHPAPKTATQAFETPWELRNGIDWSEPQQEPPASRFAGRWASHAIVKGVVDLPPITPPTFFSRIGDLQICNSIDVVFFHQGRFMTTSVTKVTRDLSHPLQEDAEVPDDDQPPPYST